MLKEFHNVDSLSITDGDTTQTSECSPQPSIDTEFLKSVTYTLKQIIIANKKKAHKMKPMHQGSLIFTSKSIPAISLLDYLQRIKKYAKAEESTFVVSLIYIDRVCKNKKVSLNEFNVHKLILASTVVAIKYNEDKFYSNKYYAKIGGVTLEEMNTLESGFINCIDFYLFVDSKVFEMYERNLINFKI